MADYYFHMKKNKKINNLGIRLENKNRVQLFESYNQFLSSSRESSELMNNTITQVRSAAILSRRKGNIDTYYKIGDSIVFIKNEKEIIGTILCIRENICNISNGNTTVVEKTIEVMTDSGIEKISPLQIREL
jgi:hypothetical protein